MKRIYHTWDKWECYPYGFYEENAPKGMTNEDCETLYKEMLSDENEFSFALEGVISEWKNSCEHYLTNERMNRIAWMGQAALAYRYKIPSRFRGGYNLLTEEQKIKADSIALTYINKWMIQNGHEAVSEDDIESKTKANLY